MSTSNAVGRLTQAATDDCSWPITQASIVTDQWFSYSPRGETTDVWESTRHSGGYYHSTASYYANGALNMLNPLNNAALPTITYGVDGEGRPNTAGASSGMNPVLSTAYDVASRVTGVTLGTYDSDAFTFDPNSGRVTQYKHTVGATPQSVIGNLTWNQNGTLKQLAITDPFNAANQQTCSYGYDDLARISSANCGSPWSQTFGFDSFGNLTKSGSVSFQPQYNTATNRMQSLPGFTPTYDANGNTLTDSLHTYTWDVQGRVTAVDTVGLTYDALGRMVEQNRSGSYRQILYGPNGGKLALMNGQSVVKAFVPLPAGATAVYVGSTLSYFRHPDWLGSSRFASTPGRTMYYSGAYAPFGESYAEAGTADRSFTGQNQDTVPDSTAGLYDFLFRQYAQYGRWISPDPAGLAAADPASPQSWNLYAYVRNDPIGKVDPSGLFIWGIGPGGIGGLCIDVFDGTCVWAPSVAEWDDLHNAGPEFCGAATIGEGNCGWRGNTWTPPGLGSGFLEGENSINFAPPPLLSTILDLLGIPTPDLSNCMPICDLDKDVPLDPARDIFHCPNCPAKWNAAAQVTHPCTIGLFYGGSAVAATFGSVASGGQVFPELASSATPVLAQAGNGFVNFMNRGRQLAQRVVSWAALTVGSALQSTCNSMSP